MAGPGSRSRPATAHGWHRHAQAPLQLTLGWAAGDLAEGVAPGVEVDPHAVGVAEQSTGGRLRLGELGSHSETGVAAEALLGAVLGPDVGDISGEGLAVDPPYRAAQLSGGDPTACVGEHRRAGRVEQPPPCSHTCGGGRAVHEARTLFAPDARLPRRSRPLALLLLGPLTGALRLADVRANHQCHGYEGYK